MASEGLHADSITLPDMVDRTQQRPTVGGMISAVASYRELLKNLVLKDLKLKYRGSVFGFLWSLVNPLLMIVVYTIAFTFILRTSIPGFVFYLMLGLLAWTFFASSASMSTGAIVDNGGLLKSVRVPPGDPADRDGAVQPGAVPPELPGAVSADADLVSGAARRADAALPGVSGAAGGVHDRRGADSGRSTAFFRDVRHLLEVALALLFWTTPIVYALSHVAERFRTVIRFSPVSPFVVAYHDMFFYGRWPEPSTWLAAASYAAWRWWSGRGRSSRSKIGSRSSSDGGPIIDARSVSKRFLLRHNPSVELKPLPRPAARTAERRRRGVLGAAQRLRDHRARRSGRPGRPQRLGQEHVPEAGRRHPPADQRPAAGRAARGSRR